MKRLLALIPCFALLPTGGAAADPRPYAVVDTGQSGCYDDRGAARCPKAGQPFFGQDAQVNGNRPAYRDNSDGTVSDLVTGLMWQKAFRHITWAQAAADAADSRVGGHDDWRVPTTKELYSLIDFDGATGTASPRSAGAPRDARPYLDSAVFEFEYPREHRFIDAQYVTRTVYRSTVMNGQRAFFGVNFADGRIKGYPLSGGPSRRSWYGRWVRGNPDYGRNDFADNGDGTVSDRATGLVWTKGDSGDPDVRRRLTDTDKKDGRLDWGEALAFCNGLDLAGRAWRLPNAKELHSLVDYDRAPDATDSAALSPIFDITAIADEDGKTDWPYFWSSTSHRDGRRPGDFAVYIAFGRAGGHLGADTMGGPMGGPAGGQGGGFRGPPPMMGGPMGGRNGGFGGPMGGRGGFASQDSSNRTLIDVHGAGAQRSSPKSGDESRLPKAAGPQGDVLRIYNFARCVSGGA